MSDEVLQIAEKRREAKGKGEQEKYTHLNAEFQRIARRDKKAFLRGQCKEIEENNRMGKTRDLLKRVRDTKGPFHAKMVTINREIVRTRRNWHPTPVFLPGESQGRGILMGCCLWGRTELDTTEAT